MSAASSSTGTRCNIIISISTILFILIIVIVGLCVRFLTEGNVQRIVLILLICILAVFGMAAVIVLEVRRRRDRKNNKNKKKNLAIDRIAVRANYKAAPTAPPIGDQSSWNYSRDYTNRTTVQA
jgi:uncharacterized membrane protein YbhN (UPF0104 family)